MPNPKETGLSDNAIGAIAYFTPVMAVFFLAIRRYNKRPYVRFHAWQSLVFNVFTICFGYALAYILPFIRFLGPRVLVAPACLAALAVFLLWLWCVISALNGKRFKLPIIGAWADEQAYR
ncbi:MAG: hypothetical protein WB341_05850 [Terracidiphilus sp.]